MHWIYIIIGGAFFGFGLGSIADAALTFVIDSYRDVGPLHSISFWWLSLILHLNRSPVTPSRVLYSFEMPSTLAFRLLLRHGWSEMVCRICSLPIACGFINLGISLLIIPMVFYGKRSRAGLAARYYRLVKQQGSNHYG